MYTPLIQRTLTFSVLLTLFIMLSYLPSIIFSGVLFTILLYILWYEWPPLCPYAGIRAALITLAYPVLPFVLMIYMNEYYHNLFMGMLITVASFDVGAYVVGSRWGKHPLLPRISPGKTGEGVVGGLLLAGIALTLLMRYYAIPYTSVFLVGATLILCTAALIGDLFESWLKRRAGIKDSARILPGHGGFLDRFDSHMVAIFVLYAMRKWLSPL
ncbi:MAG: phosphatidate cytidylyltransferase [Candidatus Babeliales bacterium]